MTTTIKKRYKVIKSFIEKWQSELQALQEKCDHTENAYKYKSSTGNYDGSSSIIRIDYECLDCGKKWTEFD